MKTKLINRIKNLGGWTSTRKIIAIAVDDYGNVRMASKKAQQILLEKGILKKDSFFDNFDHLETRLDIEKLADVLNAVKDSKGNTAVLTPYCLSHNIDFEKTLKNDFDNLYTETLPTTFEKREASDQAAYKGAFSVWKDGIKEKIIAPEFHGMLHFNQHLFMEGLINRDRDLMEALQLKCHITTARYRNYTHNWTAAFSYRTTEEFNEFRTALKTGTETFKMMYGTYPKVFTAPAQQFPYQLDKELKKYHLTTFDRPFLAIRDYGKGTYKYHNYKTGQKKGMTYIVRNVVFEPRGNTSGSAVKKALDQIDAAFKMKKPAIISSHRVNFGSYIEESIGEIGLSQLKLLLQHVVTKYKNVEFMSVNDLQTEIQNKHV